MRFQKGHVSWLKGTKGLIKSNSGSFKKGGISLNKGKKASEELRKKLSEAHKGQPAYWKGKKLPQYIKDKLSKANRGKNRQPKSEEHKRKLSEGKKGDKNPQFKDGLTWLQRKELLAGSKRPSQCEICGAMGKICFDHDHQTGKFRGWLCTRCNFALGLVKDNIEVLDTMINYLNKSK